MPNPEHAEFYVDPVLSKIQFYGGQNIALEENSVIIVTGANNSGKSTMLGEIHSRLSEVARPRGQYNIIEFVEIDWPVPPESRFQEIRRKYNSINRSGYDYFMLPGREINEHQLREDSRLDNSFGRTAPAYIRFDDAISRIEESKFKSRTDSVFESNKTPSHLIEDLVGDPEAFEELKCAFYDVFLNVLTLDDLGAELGFRLGDVVVDGQMRSSAIDPLFKQELRSKPTIESQGFGMRATLGILLSIVAGEQRILLIDEPEAFLHPPQAMQLAKVIARLAKDRKKCVFIATHDRTLINGLIGGLDENVQFVRLERSEESSRVDIINKEALLSGKSSSLLKYTPVLDSLFYNLTIVVEGESDALFFSAAIDEFLAEDSGKFGLTGSDILFLPAGGKSAQSSIVKLLKQFDIPVLAICDFDVFSNRGQYKILWESFGGEWPEVGNLFDSINRRITGVDVNETSREMISGIEDILDDLKGQAEISKNKVREAIEERLRAKTGWSSLKKTGLDEVSGELRSHLEDLILTSKNLGIVVNPHGELESFANFNDGFNYAKNSEWSRLAVDHGLHRMSEVQEFVGVLMNAAGRGN